MSDLPATLTYFGSLQNISQVINKSALPLKQAHQLADPFLPDSETEMAFTVSELFDAAVKHIAHAILGRSAPRGQPNHPLQKAVMRWRMENRFNDEAEIKEALQGLLPAMVEKTFNDAKENHRQWIDYVSSKRIVPLFEKFQDLQLWEQANVQHKGAAIKFRCDEDSIFEKCFPAQYAKIPASTVDLKTYIGHMVGTIPEIEFDPKQTLLAQNYAKRSLKEWRLIADDNEFDEQWLEFPVKLIQSVYIGALVPEKMAEQLKNHLAKLNPKIHVYQARCRTHEYSLEFDKISEHLEEEEVTSSAK